MELGSRKKTWSGCIWERVARGVPTSKMAITTKPTRLTAGLFKNVFRDWFVSYCLLC